MFEVDHPATQAGKLDGLAKAQLIPPPWLIFVPVDFEHDDLRTNLVSADFQPNEPAFFTWLGVVPYLTEDAIARTLDFISSIPSAQVVFDYLGPPEEFSDELREIEKARAEQLEKMGERSSSRFDQAGMAALLRAHGFGAIEDISFHDIASRFGHAVQGLAPGHLGAHVVLAAANRTA
jgi:methyltransferase (TIGR00027 family)